MDQETEDRLTNIEREQEAARSILTDCVERIEAIEKGVSTEPYAYGFPTGKPWVGEDDK
jgi:hypothetical protein